MAFPEGFEPAPSATPGEMAKGEPGIIVSSDEVAAINTGIKRMHANLEPLVVLT